MCTGADSDRCSRLRADAARNRERILEAAREVFASHGVGAPLETVAKHAGVGIATLYRRFPTRGELVVAAFEDKLQALLDVGTASLALDDPWEGFTHFLRSVCHMQASDPGFAALFSADAPDHPDFHDYCRRILDSFEKLVARAKQAGDLRDDFATADFMLLLNANAGVIAATRDTDPDAWERMLRYTLDGFKNVPAAQRARASG